MQMTFAHWTFVAVVCAIVLCMVFRRGVITISILGIVALALQSPNAGEGAVDHVVFAAQSVFQAILLAGNQLLDIIVLIALMLAMLRSLQVQGVDRKMVEPLRRLMIGPKSAFVVLAVTMYLASVFFMPSPATALIGTVLIPVAESAGLPAIGGAMAINIAGHGMALSADPVVQAAVRITSGASNVPSMQIFPYTVLFSLIVGLVALTLGAMLLWRDMRAGKTLSHSSETVIHESELEVAVPEQGRFCHFLAILVPVVLLSVAGLMIYRGVMTPEKAIYGSGATALLGGTATVLLIIASFAHEGHKAMEGIVVHMTEGFLFSVQIFVPVLPVVAFFLLGDATHGKEVLGPGTPGYLLDVGQLVGSHVGGEMFLLAPMVMLVAFLAGIDGSGFGGLPLVGAISIALSGGDPHKTAILAAIGQVTVISTGGGAVVPWSGVIAVAGVAKIKAEDLAARNFLPMMAGFLAAGVVATLLIVGF